MRFCCCGKLGSRLVLFLFVIVCSRGRLVYMLHPIVVPSFCIPGSVWVATCILSQNLNRYTPRTDRSCADHLLIIIQILQDIYIYIYIYIPDLYDLYDLAHVAGGGGVYPA